MALRTQDAAFRRHHRALERVKERLDIATGEIPQEVEEELHPAPPAAGRLPENAMPRLAELAEELKAVLAPAQWRVAETFSPCVIPPDDLRDPVRAGEAASGNGPGEEWLRIARMLSSRDAEQVAAGLTRLVLWTLRDWLGELPDDVVASETTRAKALFLRVRAMSDEDFETSLGDLLAELFRPIGKMQEMEKQLATVREWRVDLFPRPAHYLLNPAIVPLLQAKMENLARAGVAPPDPIDEDLRAPTCETCGKGTGEHEGPHIPPVVEDFSALAHMLELDRDESGKALAIIRRSQIRLWDLVAEPREDGRNLADEFRGVKRSGYHGGPETVRSPACLAGWSWSPSRNPPVAGRAATARLLPRASLGASWLVKFTPSEARGARAS
ncbi:MAG: hypothetical protein HY720_26615 [Planctomycetes bacterium]|nr:hypothetical protein [Planctomycetota bacterium]